MKKKANIIMVLIIVLMVVAGVSAALWLSGSFADDGIGSQFAEPKFEKGVLISSDSPENVCSITIVCTTILDNLEKLEEGKLPYVPADGVVLAKTEVEFSPGETAFDVLQRVCSAGDIQLEFSWTPLYDSYYVEGISHLYEFDCGFESGWMYKVNENFPNYGSSSYEMKNRDDMVWCYTCVGLGTDVGGYNW